MILRHRYTGPAPITGPAMAVALAIALAVALILTLGGCGNAPGSTIAPATGGVGSGLVDGSPVIDGEGAVPDLPNELIPPNTFIVDTRVSDGVLTVSMTSGLSEDELVDFYSQAIEDLGADPDVSTRDGALRITWESDAAGSGEVRITEGTPTTIELVVRS
jgi:hypothetical protein